MNNGAWKGDPAAWGKHRFQLIPTEDTQTFGRENSSIHGGGVPGSAGCIDLIDQMDEFTGLMLARFVISVMLESHFMDYRH